MTLSAVLALSLYAATADAIEAQVPREYEIKAVFLYNFARFVRWPDDTAADGGNESFELCTLGQDPFGTALDGLDGKLLGLRRVGVRRLADMKGIASCHLVFVARSEQSRFTEILTTLCRHPILTVSEAEGFTESGGAINFVIRDNKIRFTINAEAAGASGLELSSKLLSLAVPLNHGSQ